MWSITGLTTGQASQWPSYLSPRVPLSPTRGVTRVQTPSDALSLSALTPPLLKLVVLILVILKRGKSRGQKGERTAAPATVERGFCSSSVVYRPSLGPSMVSARVVSGSPVTEHTQLVLSGLDGVED